MCVRLCVFPGFSSESYQWSQTNKGYCHLESSCRCSWRGSVLVSEFEIMWFCGHDVINEGGEIVSQEVSLVKSTHKSVPHYPNTPYNTLNLALLTICVYLYQWVYFPSATVVTHYHTFWEKQRGPVISQNGVPPHPTQPTTTTTARPTTTPSVLPGPVSVTTSGLQLLT